MLNIKIAKYLPTNILFIKAFIELILLLYQTKYYTINISGLNTRVKMSDHTNFSWKTTKTTDYLLCLASFAVGWPFSRTAEKNQFWLAAYPSGIRWMSGIAAADGRRIVGLASWTLSYVCGRVWNSMKLPGLPQNR